MVEKSRRGLLTGVVVSGRLCHGWQTFRGGAKETAEQTTAGDLGVFSNGETKTLYRAVLLL